jgi:hypothetical protein
MNDLFDALKKYGGPVLLGFGVLGVVAILVAVFWLLTKVDSLPLLAVGGVVVLILLLTAVAMIFSVLGLTNKDQAMGLPEGSIRAVIALSLIVLFAILSVFLYGGISKGGEVKVIANLSDTERADFIRNHATASDLQSVQVKDKDGQPLVLKDKDGKPVTNADGSLRYFYDVSYRSTNQASDDFAKQLLVLLGTLMTAITSFYLGAGTATSAARAADPAMPPPPSLTGIDPTTHSIANDGAVVHLAVIGTNLNVITGVKIVRAGLQVVATNVASNAARVTCDIPVSAATTPPGDPWAVVVDDGGSISATLPAALTIS